MLSSVRPWLSSMRRISSAPNFTMAISSRYHDHIMSYHTVACQSRKNERWCARSLTMGQFQFSMFWGKGKGDIYFIVAISSHHQIISCQSKQKTTARVLTIGQCWLALSRKKRMVCSKQRHRLAQILVSIKTKRTTVAGPQTRVVKKKTNGVCVRLWTQTNTSISTLVKYVSLLNRLRLGYNRQQCFLRPTGEHNFKEHFERGPNT